MSDRKQKPTANPWVGHPRDDRIEMVARIVDPEAFGLPAWRPSDGSDYLTDRDEARDKAAAILPGDRRMSKQQSTLPRSAAECACETECALCMLLA